MACLNKVKSQWGPEESRNTWERLAKLDLERVRGETDRRHWAEISQI